MRRGLLAEFAAPEALLGAVVRLREAGFTRLETFTPYPLREVEEHLDLPRSRIPVYALAGGLGAAGYAYLVMWWTNGFDYPLNVGGRPLNSVPAWIPVTFEMGVLGASLACLVFLLGFAGLPRLWHPVFEVEGFERASVDRFFLGIDEGDPRFDEARLEDELGRAGAIRVERLGGRERS